MNVLSLFDGISCGQLALLHDTIEDTEITIDVRYLGLPESVLGAVDAITHRTHEPLVEYYARIKCNPLATKVKLADAWIT